MLERKAPPTFPLVIEMRERAYWVTHWVEDSVDCLLHAKVPVVQVSIGFGAVSPLCSSRTVLASGNQSRQEACSIPEWAVFIVRQQSS